MQIYVKQGAKVIMFYTNAKYNTKVDGYDIIVIDTRVKTFIRIVRQVLETQSNWLRFQPVQKKARNNAYSIVICNVRPTDASDRSSMVSRGKTLIEYRTQKGHQRYLPLSGH